METCDICGKTEIKNLYAHIRLAHPELYQDMKDTDVSPQESVPFQPAVSSPIPQAKTPPFGQMTEGATAMNQMVQAMGGMLQLVREMQPAPVQQPSLLDQIEEAKEIAQLTGGAGKNPNTEDMMLMQLLQHANQQKAAQGQVSLGDPNQPAVPPANNSEVDSMKDPTLAFVESVPPTVKNLIKSGRIGKEKGKQIFSEMYPQYTEIPEFDKLFDDVWKKIKGDV